MSLQQAEMLTDNDNSRMSGTQQDNEDECDSSYVFKRKQALVVMSEEQSDTSSLKRACTLSVTGSSGSSKAPPIVIQKVNVSSSRVNVRPTIKPVAAVSSPSLTSRIDKIVDNLKQKQQQKPSPPRVAPVVHDRHSSKMLLHQRILMSLRRQEKENRVGDTESESSSYDDDSLTSLNWLNKYNLTASTGFQPISPPLTPPSRSRYIPSRVHMTRPVVNPLILKRTPASSGDESDGCSNHMGSGEATASLLSMLRGIDVAGSSKRSTLRPPYSYSSLAFLAIESSARKRLSVKEIYNWITDNVPYYSSVPSGSWKNSIRHNLASSQVFCKVDKNLLAMRDFSGKGSLWCINPEYRESLIESVRQCGNDFVKLAEIKLLQDVNENISGGGSSTSTIRSNSASSLTSPNRSNKINNRFGLDQPVRINERLNTKNIGGAAYINPNIRNLTNKANNPYMKQPIYKAHINKLSVNSDSNELDAVKALLTMKSRSASVPSGGKKSGVQEEQQAMTSSISSKQSATSRRKQLFKPPKRVDDLDNQDDDNDSEPFDDYFYSDSEMLDDLNECDEDMNSSDSTSNSKSTNKLVVKFAFKNDSASKRKTSESEEETGSKKKIKSSSKNTLLELSHAASLVEDESS